MTREILETFSRAALAALLTCTLSLAACSDDSTNTPPKADKGVTADAGPQADGSAAGCPAPTKALAGVANTCVLEGGANNPITTDLTLVAGNKYLLKGGVFIGDDAGKTVLTIEPGVTIYGDTSALSFLVVRRGSQLMADGTREKPIVFTSAQAKGKRKRGDWGGVIVNGRASINACDPANVPPSGCEAEGEGGTGKYGGKHDDDSSGVLRYVRIEFAGALITSKNELNALAMQGVGRGTTLEYIQVHMGEDDGIEFFGGTVNFKYILATGNSDDNLDWTDGWRGKGQFFVAQQYGDAGDNGIEADNNAENNNYTPRSHPILSNVTLIGSNTAKSDLAMLLREGTAAELHNVIAANWEEGCLTINHDATFENAWSTDKVNGQLVLDNSILNCTANTVECKADGTDPVCTKATPFSVADFVSTLNEGNRLMDPKLVDPTNEAAPDFRPAADSPARTGAKVPGDAFFDQVTFIGAVDPDNDWTQGWTTTEQN